MKTILLCLVLLFVVNTKGEGGKNNWPDYLKKCRKTATNLEPCLVAHANFALDAIMKGDPSIGIPQYNDYSVGDINFGQNDTYKLHMENAKIYGLKHIYVSGFKWNFDKQTVDIRFVYNDAITLSGNYQSNGIFKGRDVTGLGKLDLIFVGGSYGGNLTYSMEYDLLEVLGRKYVQIKSTTCTCSGGLRINFSNKIKPKALAESDLAFWNKNSKAASESMLAQLAELFGEVVNEALGPIFYNFPMVENIYDNLPVNIIFD